MKFFEQFRFSTLWGRLEAEDLPAQEASALLKRISELEARVAKQQRHLTGASSFLQQAAYLARYHQPSLEREIRAFLAEVEAERSVHTPVAQA